MVKADIHYHSPLQLSRNSKGQYKVMLDINVYGHLSSHQPPSGARQSARHALLTTPFKVSGASWTKYTGERGLVVLQPAPLVDYDLLIDTWHKLILDNLPVPEERVKNITYHTCVDESHITHFGVGVFTVFSEQDYASD